MGFLTNLIEKRKKENRDLKIIITAKDSETGTGKTTLAVKIARVIDKNWNANRGCFDLNDYINLYNNAKPNSSIIFDEIEQAADNRRSMTNKNLKLSHAWAMLRYRQVHTIVTLPSVTMLEKRLKELADVRIHVHKRGYAAVKKISIDDIHGTVYEKTIQHIRWGPLDDDPEYQKMCEMKHDYSVGYFEKKGVGGKNKGEDPEELKKLLKQKEKEIETLKSEHEKKINRVKNETIMDMRRFVSNKLYTEYDWSQRKIAKLFGKSQDTVRNWLKKERTNSVEMTQDNMLYMETPA